MSARPLRILLVEDTEDDALLLLRYIKRGGYEPVSKRVQSGAALDDALSTGTWDIVISDYSMPGFSGLEALMKVRERGLDLPFLIVSGAIGEETAVALMRAGAHDYIMKDNLVRLLPAVERELREARIRDERRRADERVLRSLKEKELLLKEIHHRVKNNMQIMASLLKLQASQMHDERDRELIKKSLNRIRAMAIVHERLYQSDDISRIDIRTYVEDLVKNLLSSYALYRERINIDVEIDGIAFDVDTATPFGLIVCEIVTNAIVHAFGTDREGKITISVLETAEDEYLLKVIDNGAGLGEGITFETTSGLGMNLIASLSGQLSGTAEVIRPSAGGTEFHVRFRRKRHEI